MIPSFLMIASLYAAEARADAFTDAKAAGQWGEAAVAAAALSGPDGDRKLGEAAENLGYPHAALVLYTAALRADPAGSASLLDEAQALVERTGDTYALAGITPHASAEPAAKAAQNLLLAKMALESGDLAGAAAKVTGVDPTLPTFAESEALRGVILNQQGKPLEALAPLLTAQAAAKQSSDADPDFLAAMDLNLARSFYAADNFVKAIEHYAKVPRESPFWWQATYERAWSHFMLNDMSGTLGHLLTVRAPFFSGYYLPEGDLLAAQTYFLVCRFEDTTAEIDAFEARWDPVRAELASALPGLTPDAAWTQVGERIVRKDTALPDVVLVRFTEERRHLSARAAVRGMENERERLGKGRNVEWSARVIPMLEAREVAIRTVEGARVLSAAVLAKSELDAWDKSLEITRLDILDAERKLFEAAARTGALPEPPPTGKVRRKDLRPGTQRYPFEGEFWGDELGYYRIEISSACPVEG